MFRLLQGGSGSLRPAVAGGAIVVAAALAACGASDPAADEAQAPATSDESSAAPAPRALYLTHTAAFRHAVLEASHDVMRDLAASTGGFEVTITEDTDQLTADALADYDVLVFYTTGELPMSSAQQDALLDFVAGGKGFVGIHSGSDTFYEWPEYGRMLGGYFDGHPWHQEVTVTVEDPDHPATRHLPASFTIDDEIYQIKDWSRSDVQVLLSLDTESVDLDLDAVNRDDGDFALAWTRSYGAGRVFYTALGHEEGVWRDERFQTHLVEGIRWAAGLVDGGRVEHNTLTAREDADGWRLLFDGETIDAWRGFKEEALPGGWTVEDGAIVRTGEGGDIVTVDQFDDFELKIDWMVETGGNSGIFFRVTEDADAVWHTAPEVQVLDDANHADGRNPETSAGSNYALHAPSRDVVRPAGEWNHVRLRVEGDHVEHWMNGVKIVEYELGSPEWTALVEASKFAPFPYGRSSSGHLALQDHGDRVAFRNIKVRSLR